MKTLLAVLLVLPSILPAADLPPEIKPTAEEFDRNMAIYDANEKTLLTVERDRYKAALDVARTREVSGKRADGVAAIDAELAALETGSIPEGPPAHLPRTILTYRTRFQTAPERIKAPIDNARKFARAGYIQWLEGMVEVARRGKSESLEAAAQGEIDRVRASIASEKDPAEKG